jgi:hypothetical protein
MLIFVHMIYNFSQHECCRNHWFFLDARPMGSLKNTRHRLQVTTTKINNRGIQPLKYYNTTMVQGEPLDWAT